MASVQGLEPGQTAGRRLRIADILGARIEATTRFKTSDLKELAADTDSSAELLVTTRQRADLDVESGTQPGRLPPGTTHCPDPAALHTALQQQLACAESSAAASIQQWATEEPGQYRRLLVGAALFGSRAHETFGTEWVCTPCAQTGHIPCTACGGQGARTCPDCQGCRRCACRDCRGLGRIACRVCEGRATVKGAAPDNLVPCAACSQGWLTCTACTGRGESDCARCQACGSVPCADCSGQGMLDCVDCQTSGWQHRWGRLRERLEVEDRLEIHHPDPAVVEAIARHLPDVPTLDAVCTLDQVRYTTAPLAVQATHRLRLAVRHGRLQVAGQAMSFVAIGPALNVVDLQGIGAVLLGHDLATLEKNVAGTGRHLLDALQRFLQSPLNREIAAAAQPSPCDAAPPCADLVDAAYPPRAQAAVRQAIERLWLQRLWRPRWLGLCGVGMVAALGGWIGSPQVGLGTATALALGVGALVWPVLEWQARQGLARSLQTPEADRLLRPLRRSAVVRQWQWKTLAAAALVALVSAAAVTRLPPIRQETAQAQSSRTLDQQLDAWLLTEGKDHQLRAYPDVAALEQALAHSPADPRARLVRAWQLLLGVGGVSPDPRAAERLLAGLNPEPRLANATVIAQARLTLSLNHRSVSALQAAATALERLPDPPPPEGLYTLALLQLHPVLSARLGGTQQGLSTLQLAADLGHASACFELGRRLAQGTGLRRDLAAARRYLGYAQTKGVPGAAELVQRLR